MKKVLVDTNIWSTLLRRNSPQDTKIKSNFSQLLEEGRIMIIGPIRQEILSGIREEKNFRILKQYLAAFEDSPIESMDYENAAELSNVCIAKGIAASAIDLLIVSCSIRNGWEIYTKDKDFSRYEKISKLKHYIER